MRTPFKRCETKTGTIDLYAHENDTGGTEQYAVARWLIAIGTPRYSVTNLNPHDRGRRGVK